MDLDSDLVMRVEGLSQLETDGGDTIIFTMPPEFMVRVDENGPPALAAVQFARFLRGLANQQARDLNSIIHHAEFRVTKSIATVEEFGVFPEHADCLDCQRGVLTAVEYMKEHPDREMVVGQLFWAAPPSS